MLAAAVGGASSVAATAVLSLSVGVALVVVLTLCACCKCPNRAITEEDLEGAYEKAGNGVGDGGAVVVKARRPANGGAKGSPSLPSRPDKRPLPVERHSATGGSPSRGVGVDNRLSLQRALPQPPPQPPPLTRDSSSSDLYATVSKRADAADAVEQSAPTPRLPHHESLTYDTIDAGGSDSADPLYEICSPPARPTRSHDYEYPYLPLGATARATDAAAAAGGGAESEGLYSSIASEGGYGASAAAAAAAARRTESDEQDDPRYERVRNAAHPLLPALQERASAFDHLYARVNRHRRHSEDSDLYGIPQPVAPAAAPPAADGAEVGTAKREPSYRYLTVRESLDALRRRLAHQEQRVVVMRRPVRPASDPYGHYYASIDDDYGDDETSYASAARARPPDPDERSSKANEEASNNSANDETERKPPAARAAAVTSPDHVTLVQVHGRETMERRRRGRPGDKDDEGYDRLTPWLPASGGGGGDDAPPPKPPTSPIPEHSPPIDGRRLLVAVSGGASLPNRARAASPAASSTTSSSRAASERATSPTAIASGRANSVPVERAADDHTVTVRSGGHDRHTVVRSLVDDAAGERGDSAEPRATSPRDKHVRPVDAGKRRPLPPATDDRSSVVSGGERSRESPLPRPFPLADDDRIHGGAAVGGRDQHTDPRASNGFFTELRQGESADAGAARATRHEPPAAGAVVTSTEGYDNLREPVSSTPKRLGGAVAVQAGVSPIQAADGAVSPHDAFSPYPTPPREDSNSAVAASNGEPARQSAVGERVVAEPNRSVAVRSNGFATAAEKESAANRKAAAGEIGAHSAAAANSRDHPMHSTGERADDEYNSNTFPIQVVTRPSTDDSPQVDALSTEMGQRPAVDYKASSYREKTSGSRQPTDSPDDEGLSPAYSRIADRRAVTGRQPVASRLDRSASPQTPASSAESSPRRGFVSRSAFSRTSDLSSPSSFGGGDGGGDQTGSSARSGEPFRFNPTSSGSGDNSFLGDVSNNPSHRPPKSGGGGGGGSSEEEGDDTPSSCFCHGAACDLQVVISENLLEMEKAALCPSSSASSDMESSADPPLNKS